jgi:hypothetical protein
MSPISFDFHPFCFVPPLDSLMPREGIDGNYYEDQDLNRTEQRENG